MFEDNMINVFDTIERNPGGSLLDLLAFDLFDAFDDEDESPQAQKYRAWVQATKDLLKSLIKEADDFGYEEAKDNLRETLVNLA